MAYQQRDDSGSVFRNDRKREGKKDPDFTGSGMVNGEEVWIDMWTKAPEGGKKGYFSISFRQKSPPSNRQQSQPSQQRQAPTTRSFAPPPKQTPDPDLDPASEDDIPF